MNIEECKKLVRLCFAQYPNVEIKNETVDSYFLGLSAYGFNDCMKAAALFFQSPGRKFPPNSSEIISKLGDLGKSLPKQEEKQDIEVSQHPDMERFQNVKIKTMSENGIKERTYLRSDGEAFRGEILKKLEKGFCPIFENYKGRVIMRWELKEYCVNLNRTIKIRGVDIPEWGLSERRA